MSMSLVGDYGGSESEEDSQEEDESEEEEKKPAKPSKPPVSLPSAADLFDSVDTASFMTTPSPAAESPYTATPKRRTNSASAAGKDNSNKKSKSATDKAANGGASRGLLPPQMSRPNIVTEDSALWSSDATVKRQKQLEAERRAAGKGADKGKDLTFRQREKAKRDKGQASRGKSYVEEEKRLLRELGSS